MKIGIIGDTHFGAAYNLGKTDPTTQLNSRLIDFSDTFNHIVDVFHKKGVEKIILTGDIFETRSPTPAQVNAFSHCLNRIVQMGKEVIIVVGNHDQQRHIDTTTVDVFGILNLPGVHVYQNISAHSIDIGEKTPLSLILIPYKDRRMLNTNTNSEAINIISEQIKAMVKSSSGKKMLVGHLMIENTLSSDNPDGFSINELIMPVDTFRDIDVTIMGHVHRHNVISQDPYIVYSGSMEKVSFGEKNHRKVSLIVDTTDMSVDIIDTPTRALVDISLDYSDQKSFKSSINDKIIKDIDSFITSEPIEDAIIRFYAKVSEDDLYYINNKRIREHLFSKNIHNLASIQTQAITTRQLRNSNINETVDTSKAMIDFINGLREADTYKKKLIKSAVEIMEEVVSK